MTGSSDDAISMQDLAARGAERDESEWEQRWRSVTPDDICTFIYTSGTTGPPKGCVISHGNYRSMLDMVNAVLGDRGGGAHLPLPAPRPLLRAADPVRQLRPRRDARLLGARPAEDRPQPGRGPADLLPVGAADLREDLHRCHREGRERPAGSRRRSSTGRSGSARRCASWSARAASPGPLLRWQYEIADKQVLSKIRGLFGGRLRLAVSGAAPINPEILRFFEAAGVLVLEGWGMTETSTAATISTPEDYKIGTIGKPFPGCEVKIADDGEILVKGPNVFQGYYKNEEATRETLVDGWLHTGDIGEIDEDGYIKITGRKKDIIITAGRQEHHPRQPRGRDQAAPAGLPVRRDRRPPPLPGGAGHARPRGGRHLRQGARPARGPRGAGVKREGARRRSRRTSSRSTRSSPASSR